MRPKKFFKLSTIVIFIMLAAIFSGCENEHVMNPSNASGTDLTFIPLVDSGTMQNLYTSPIAQKIKWATDTKSTKITLNHEDGGLDYQVKVTVKKNSLNRSGNLTVTLDDDRFFIGTFEPTSDGGMALSKISYLNFTITGGDLSGMLVDYIKPYYHNLSTGLWEEMDYNSITVDSIAGTIEIVEAKMPDFGRYALYNPDVFNPGVLTGTTEWISYEDGGELIIDYKRSEHGGGPEEVRTTFKIDPYTISRETWVTLSMSDSLTSGNCNATFGPHGLTFSSPALLNIEAKNIDLSGLNPDSLKLYYTPYGSDEWEEIEVYDIIVNQETGYVKIIDAQLHHFSRYALAHG